MSYRNIGGGSDATSIQTIPVSEEAPTANEVLKYNAVTGRYEPAPDEQGGGGGGGYPPDYASLTGSTFTGPVNAQVTGSITRTSAGTPFITAPAGNVITVSTGSNGQVILSGSGGSLSGYARLDGALFSGPLTASLGVHGPRFSLPNGGEVIARNSADTADLTVFQASSGNALYIGGLGNAGYFTQVYITSNGVLHNLVSNGYGFSTYAADGSVRAQADSTAGFNISNNNSLGTAIKVRPVYNGSTRFSFTDTVTTASVDHDSTANGVAAHMAVRAQSSTGATSTGGSLTLASGGGTSTTGSVAIQTGATTRVNVAPTLTTVSNNAVFSGSLKVAGNGDMVREYDSVFRVHNLDERRSTSNATLTTLCSFLSGANGRTYAADAIVTAQHTTTIESYRAKLSAHFRRTAGSMVLIASDQALTSSNVAALSSSLEASSGNIIVRGAGTTTGSFNWGVSLSVRELGV